MKYFYSFLVSCMLFAASFSQPVITSFSPASGPVGTVVTISGTGFNTTAASNIVFFGVAKAVVSSSTSTSLTVMVPIGATTENMTVLNTSTGLLGSSSKPFKLTYTGQISSTFFAARISFTTGTGSATQSCAAGDLDGDGKPDLVAGNTGSASISIFRNTSTPGIIDASSFTAKVDKATGTTPRGIAIGDLNGDGKPDIAVANAGSNTVFVFRNTSTIGSISFATAISLTTGTTPYDLSIADLNGDGLQDIAVANSGTTTISVFKNTMSTGSLSFAAKADFTVGSNPKGIAIGDIDGNGVPDIVVSNSGSTTISVLRNTTSAGSISFATKVDKTATATPMGVDIGDLDGDGMLDIAVANNFGSTGGTSSISVFRNTSTSGTISLANKSDYATWWANQRVAIEEMNGDGKPDLISNGGATNASGNVSVIQNNSTSGTLSFGSYVRLGSGTWSVGLSVADFDLDGRIDMSVTASGGNNTSVIRNNGDEPIVTSFTPTSGPAGSTVTITGDKFTGATAVSFGGTQATSFTVVNATTITAIVGSGTTGAVSVTTARGTTASSTAFTLRFELSASIWAVGGGGGGGQSFGSNSHGGGGGSGGQVNSLLTSQFSTDSSLTVTVGAGGNGANLPTTGSASTNGGASSVVKGSATILNAAGGNKGANATSTSGGTGGITVNSPAAGAGGNGGKYATTNAVNGSAGSSALSSWGAIVGYGQNVGGIYYFSGGGAGGSYSGQNTNAVGGSGGGGCTGSGCGSAFGNSGTPNTGGGGGGANSDASSGTTLAGGNGGSGIVIIRYAGSPIATGGTVAESGGYTYHTFTSSGTLSIIVVSSQPSTAPQTLCLNSTASSLSVVASGSSPSYQWYSNTTASNADGTLIAGATSSSYTPPTSTDGVAYYYCIVSSSLGTEVSNVSGAITTVSSVAGTISGGGTVTAGSNSTTLTLSGYAGSIQWQSSTDNITFSDISGATLSSYTASNLTTTRYYQAVVKNGLCAQEITTSIAIRTTSTNTWIGSSGNWSNVSNWSNGSAPALSDAIVISAGNPQLDVDFTIGESLTLSGTGTLTISPGKTLSIASGGAVDFGGKSVTFKSDASGTAQLGVVSGALTGATNVVVERHIPAGKRAFRFFSSPVTTTTSLRQNWMEGATPGVLSGYPNATQSAYNPNPGYGTHITGLGGNANGFDETGTNNPSLFTFNNSTGAWAEVTSTASTITAGSAYRMMVRGDRSYGISNIIEPVGGSTILRTTGTMVTGAQVSGYELPELSQVLAGWSLVGNPYQSVVDMSSPGVVKTNLTDFYYVWDPRMGTQGAYVGYNYVTNISTNTSSAVNRFIQPGQAFFVQSSAVGSVLEFAEAAKDAASNQTATFGKNEGKDGYKIKMTQQRNEMTQTGGFASLSMLLYQSDSLLKGAMPADAARVLFENGNNNNVDLQDGRKLTNPDEMLSVKQNNTLLSMELRALPDTGTVLPLSITQYRATKYTLRVFWDKMLTDSTRRAYLKDKFTAKEYMIDRGGNYIDLAYTITSDAKSSAADRFEVVFKNSANVVTSVTNYSNGDYVRTYPNPVFNLMKVEYKLGMQRELTLKVYDMSGREVLEQKKVKSGDQVNMSRLLRGIYQYQLLEKTGKLLMADKLLKN